MNVLLTLANSHDVRAGTETFATHIAKALPGLVVFDYKTISKQYNLPTPHTPLLREPFMAKSLDNWFSRTYEDVDTVFTNGMFGWALPHLTCPVINIQHGTYAALASATLRKKYLNYWRIRHIYSHFEKLSGMKSDVVVSNSAFTHMCVKKHYKMESTVINNAIDTDTIKPVATWKARDILGLPNDATICIFVGRPDSSKGYDILLEVAKSHPNILFICVLFPGIKPPNKNVKVFSYISHDRLSLFYSAADFCINPSRFEGFGYVPLESLACNTPVITSRTGVFHEYEIDGAFITEQNTAKNYSTCINTLPERVSSRKIIKALFSFEKFRKRYRELLRQI